MIHTHKHKHANTLNIKEITISKDNFQILENENEENLTYEKNNWEK